jgi:hypothetical protein
LQGTYQALLGDLDDASGVCKTMARSYVDGQEEPPKNGTIFDSYVGNSLKIDKNRLFSLLAILNAVSTSG